MIATLVFALMPGLLSTLAQQPPRNEKPPFDPATRPKFRALVESINQRVRELGLVEVNDDPDQAAFINRRRDALLIEDFQRMYTINIETIATQSSAPSPDYKALFDVTADLKNRATRIKYNVRILEIVDKGEKIRYDEYPDCLTPMLTELNRLINSFLGSPVFRLSSPNDAELRLKTSRELTSIIKLSETINKIAKRSAKTMASR
jgi:hypothetical protein